MKKVLVTGIGGGVGQGILRNIKNLHLEIEIIGTNVEELSAGNHLCDKVFKVPFAYDTNFISTIKEIIINESIDLVIPSTDYEMFYLSINQNDIPCKVASSGELAAEIYLDKYLSSNFHKANGIAFADTCLPSEYSGQYEKAIAKPRKGRGSRGIIVNLKTSDGLNDDEYIIQRLYEGMEVTTAVYVSYKTGKFHGLITMERTLENGATVFCKVVEDYDSKILETALQTIKHSKVKGAFNIQSIVTKEGEVFPFEINCRISGTNSIRAHFGFKDVKYTIDELLYNKIPQPIKVTAGVAYRYLADVIYPAGISVGNSTDNFILF